MKINTFKNVYFDRYSAIFKNTFVFRNIIFVFTFIGAYVNLVFQILNILPRSVDWEYHANNRTIPNPIGTDEYSLNTIYPEEALDKNPFSPVGVSPSINHHDAGVLKYTNKIETKRTHTRFILESTTKN